MVFLCKYAEPFRNFFAGRRSGGVARLKHGQRRRSYFRKTIGLTIPETGSVRYRNSTEKRWRPCLPRPAVAWGAAATLNWRPMTAGRAGKAPATGVPTTAPPRRRFQDSTCGPWRPARSWAIGVAAETSARRAVRPGQCQRLDGIAAGADAVREGSGFEAGFSDEPDDDGWRTR